ncbi:hypothetical protein [Nocardioides sp. NPDC047086]|uniref:hypothetical protein n=1 Tax=Nocardioides sp. NPDC047086 TaxID=3154810 RepID=UPI0033C16A51
MNTDHDGVQPGAYLTRQPGPRVLVHLSLVELGEYIAEQLRRFVPTVKVIESPDEVNLTEWDVLITAQPPSEERFVPEANGWRRPGNYPPSWKRRYPDQLCLIWLAPENQFNDDVALDVFPPEGEGSRPDVLLVQGEAIVGRHIRESDGLPEGLADLVKRVMVPVVKQRERHTPIARTFVSGFAPPSGLFQIRPFLFGPEDCILAGSYARSEEASVWVIPMDIPDIPAWLREALREWHTLYPTRFPVVPDWDNDPAWKSAAELEIIAHKEQLESEILSQVAKLREQQEALDAELNAERERAEAYERALLAKDGEVLERAVQRALGDLGFEVTNMDEIWPEGKRREDLRAGIASDPEWVAIVEIKGYTKGAKETDLFKTGRWAESFILEKQRRPSARWFVTNHNRQRDPFDRGRPFANKPEVVTNYEADDGLVIDTVTLFEALRIVQSDPSRRNELRDHLANSKGLLTLP